MHLLRSISNTITYICNNIVISDTAAVGCQLCNYYDVPLKFHRNFLLDLVLKYQNLKVKI